MDLHQRGIVFRNALANYRRGHLQAAGIDFVRLVNDGSNEPLHLSYCGLLMAEAQGKLSEGLVLCERALTINFFDPQLHLNLSRAYLLGGDRKRAIGALLRGVRNVPRDVRLREELSRLVPRSRPVFGSLRRSHPVNKYLGLARFRLAQLLQVFSGSPQIIGL